MKKEGYNIQELTELWDKLGGDIYVDLEECPIRLRDSNEEAPKSLVIQAIMPYVKQYIDVYEKNIGEQSLIPYADEAAKQLRESDLCAALSWLDGEPWHKDYDWFDALAEANYGAKIDNKGTDGSIFPYLINGWAPFLYAFCRYDAWTDSTRSLNSSVAYWADLIKKGFMVGTNASVRAIHAAKRGVLFYHTKEAEFFAQKWELLDAFNKYHNTYSSGPVQENVDVIPVGATSVAAFQFADQITLTNITIPNSVTEICNFAFSKTGLTSITIPDSVTKISDHAFNECTKLKSISLGKGLVEIGSGAFSGCKNLSKLTIPNSVSKIGFQPFYGCKKLATVTLSNGVSRIGDFEFEDCAKLNNVVIPEGISEIGSYAFSGCSSLASIALPNSVTSIGENPFLNCTNLIFNEYDNALYLGNSDNPYLVLAKAKDCSIKSCIVHADTRFILNNAFRDCRKIASIIIPDNVISINGSAFQGCTGLTSITIPAGVNKIGGSAFKDCCSLTNITLPEKIKLIYAETFAGCTKLSDIVIPEGIVYIAEDAFNGCQSLNYNEDGNARYLGNAKNPYLVLIKVIDRLADTCIVNAKTKVIADSAFLFGKATNITIPNSVTNIGHCAFKWCENLTEITIPDSVTEIDTLAFEGCTGLTSVAIGNGVTEIGGSTFKGCTGLTSITIPDSVTGIGWSAFEGCTRLTSITIPNSVVEIRSYVFEGCTGLTELHYNGTMEQWEANTKDYGWDNNTGNYTIYCTDGEIKKES